MIVPNAHRLIARYGSDFSRDILQDGARVCRARRYRLRLDRPARFPPPSHRLVIFPQPLAVDDALGVVDDWLHHPHARALNPTQRHGALLTRLLIGAGSAGNLTTDAHLAAIATGRYSALTTGISNASPACAWNACQPMPSMKPERRTGRSAACRCRIPEPNPANVGSESTTLGGYDNHKLP